MRTIYILTLLIIYNNLFSNTINYQIENAGTISIHEEFEIQSKKYKEYGKNIYLKENGDKTVNILEFTNNSNLIFQPKGINDLSNLDSYARIIFESVVQEPGDFAYVNSNPLNLNEIKQLDSEMKVGMKKQLASIGQQMLKWIGVSVVQINSQYAIKIEYIRKLTKDQPVKVNLFMFNNYDRLYRITTSYRIKQANIWQPKLDAAINSFVITNKRNKNENIERINLNDPESYYNEPNTELLTIFLIFRVFICIFCIYRAHKLKRSKVSWGIFGFVAPIITLIIILFTKPLDN